MMEFRDIVRRRYATKKFTGEKLPDDTVDELLEIVRLAPSSYNLQPWRIIVVEDEDLKEELSPAAHGQDQVTTCSHLLVFCADTDLEGITDRLETVYEATGNPKLGSIGPIRNFISNLEGKERLAWCQRQLYLALGNAVNGAKSLGFDSCPMEGFKPDAFGDILGLPDNLRPTALCAIGHAADEPPSGEKVRLGSDHVFDRH